MKVLFAVSNENISDSIVKKYQKDYERLINEKNSWIERRIDDLYAGLREIREREEKQNEKNNR